jgi:acetylglutamate kinase
MTPVTPVTVVKLGGRVQQDPALAAAVAAAWRARPGALVLVHGGGDETSALQRALGREPSFVNGRRVTGEHDLDLLRMTLSGVANKRLVGALSAAGVPALGLSGEDGGLLAAETTADLAALGRVGRVRAVNVALLRQLLDGGWLPVLSPVSSDRSRAGSALNVNGDDAAAAVAVALGAAELFFMADVAGVLRDGAAIRELDLAAAAALVADGTAAGGMAAKLEAARHALLAGVGRVRIGDLAALAEPSSGTTIVRASTRATSST